MNTQKTYILEYKNNLLNYKFDSSKIFETLTETDSHKKVFFASNGNLYVIHFMNRWNLADLYIVDDNNQLKRICSGLRISSEISNENVIKCFETLKDTDTSISFDSKYGKYAICRNNKKVGVAYLGDGASRKEVISSCFSFLHLNIV